MATPKFVLDYLSPNGSSEPPNKLLVPPIKSDSSQSDWDKGLAALEPSAPSYESDTPDFVKSYLSSDSQPTAQPGWKQTAANVVKGAHLPVTLGAAGGLAGVGIPAMTGAGAPLGAFTGPALAGLGAAGGQSIQDILLKYLEPQSAPQTLLEEFKEVGKSGLLGTASEMGGQAIAAPFKAFLGAASTPMTEEAAKPYMSMVDQGAQHLRNVAENYLPWAGPFLRGAREAKDLASQKAFQEAQESAQQYAKSLPQRLGVPDSTAAVQGLKSATDQYQKSITDPLNEFVNPVLEKQGGNIIDPAEPIASIDKILSRKKVLKSPEDINSMLGGESVSNPVLDKESVNRMVNGPSKTMINTLAKLKDNLSNVRSIDELNRTLQEMQSQSNFSGIGRSAEEKTMGGLSHGLKENLLSNVEKATSGPEAEAFNQARQNYSQNIGNVKSLQKITSKYPEEVVRGALRKFTPTFANDLVTKNPAIREHVANVLITDLATKSSTPAALTKAIDSYGRENLTKILGEEAADEVFKTEQRFMGSKIRPELPVGKIYKLISGPTKNIIGKTIGQSVGQYGGNWLSR